MTTLTYRFQPPSWQEAFVELLPAITRQARRTLGFLDAAALDDAVSEITASTCCAFFRLCERGEQERAFPSSLTKFAIYQFFQGRRCGTRQASRDVMSEVAQRKHAIEVTSIDGGSEASSWREQLTDNRSTPIPDQAAFRVDFPIWLESQSKRDRKIAERMVVGCTTGEIAKEFGVSPARVSQLRREFANSWKDFHGEFVDAAEPGSC